MSVETYSIIKAVRVTEKTTFLNEKLGKITLVAPVSINKNQINRALKVMFVDITIKSIRSITVAPKVKRFKGVLGQRKGFKKFIVTLAEGKVLDFNQGIK